jgi:hypothetical protein
MDAALQQEYNRLTGKDSSTLEGPLSEDALANLKLYKYSSVDKSFTSRYVLKHYVRFFDIIYRGRRCLNRRKELEKTGACILANPHTQGLEDGRNEDGKNEDGKNED